jgi:hypothetical protein
MQFSSLQMHAFSLPSRDLPSSPNSYYHTKGRTLTSIYFLCFLSKSFWVRILSSYTLPRRQTWISWQLLLSPSCTDTSLHCYFTWSSCDWGIRCTFSEHLTSDHWKARGLGSVFGKTLLPSASSSALAFDSLASHTMTQSGCGNCLGL